MNDALDGCRAKLGRAKKHLDALKDEVARFLEAHPYAFLVQANLGRTEYSFRAHVLEWPPLEWSLIVGDYVHNLRSALDNLMWQLALLTSGGPEPIRFDGKTADPRQIQFPISDTLEKYVNAQVRAYVDAKYMAAIQDFQPYHGRYIDPLGSPFLRLHALSNTDKHRTINAVLVSVSEAGPRFVTRDATIVDQWFEPGVPIEDGVEVAHVTVIPTGPDPDVEMHEFPVDIAFGGCPADKLPTLLEASTDVIKRCAPFFD